MRIVHAPSRVLAPLSCLTLGLCLGLGGCGVEDTTHVAEGVAEDESSDADDLEPEINWVPARGISITEIEANQGTRVALTDVNGEWRGPNDRNMVMVRDRDTLLRVHWAVADGWQPHAVKARMTLDVGADEPVVREQTITVEGDSSRTSLDRTFFFGLAAELDEVVPGARVLVELFESDLDQDTSLPEAVASAPVGGPNFIGFEATPLELKIMLVPIHYTGGGQDRRPNLSDENVKTLIDALYEHNPVHDVFYQVRGEIPYNAEMNNLGSLLPMMSSLKNNDGAGPNIYYHALIDIGCPVVGCGSAGVAGIAQLTGDSKGHSLNRVAATVFYESANSGIRSTAGTFVHEVGHNQGLAHVECPGGNAAGPDPSYPYDGGKIGEWGFAIRSIKLHNPTASHDYMSYCGNTWGSDWTFYKTYNRIRTLTSWDYEGAPAGDGGHAGLLGSELVIGALYPDGSEEWFRLDGSIDLEELMPGEALGFEVDGQVIDQPAVVRTLSDGLTQWVVAPLPEGVSLEQVDRIEHVRGGEIRRALPASDVVVHRFAPATTILR
jgi:hypothetical protein